MLISDEINACVRKNAFRFNPKYKDMTMRVYLGWDHRGCTLSMVDKAHLSDPITGLGLNRMYRHRSFYGRT